MTQTSLNKTWNVWIFCHAQWHFIWTAVCWYGKNVDLWYFLLIHLGPNISPAARIMMASCYRNTVCSIGLHEDNPQVSRLFPSLIMQSIDIFFAVRLKKFWTNNWVASQWFGMKLMWHPSNMFDPNLAWQWLTAGWQLSLSWSSQEMMNTCLLTTRPIIPCPIIVPHLLPGHWPASTIILWCLVELGPFSKCYNKTQYYE